LFSALGEVLLDALRKCSSPFQLILSVAENMKTGEVSLPLHIADVQKLGKTR
jgi:hypothetical protein